MIWDLRVPQKRVAIISQTPKNNQQNPHGMLTSLLLKTGLNFSSGVNNSVYNDSNLINESTTAVVDNASKSAPSISSISMGINVNQQESTAVPLFLAGYDYGSISHIDIRMMR